MPRALAALPPTALYRAVVLFLVGFLLVFPKGGIKLGGVPLTWGYLGLGPVVGILALVLIGQRQGALPTNRLLVLAALLPFQMIALGGLMVHGAIDAGFTIAFLVTFFFLPPAFVVVLGHYLDRVDLGFLMRLIRVSIPALAAYGIFLFIFKFTTGDFVEIPYLTVNAGDVGALEDKHIDRGGIFKLISTYNNGNLFGISMLMLLPLYSLLEKRVVPRTVVKAALVLTLSRTVWAGLVLHELLQRLYIRRVSARTLALATGSIVVVGAGIVYIVDELLELDVLAFLFDPTLGGRQSAWERLDRAGFLPGAPFEALSEMVYLSVLQTFGVLGLAAFLVAMFASLALFLARAVPFHGSAFKRSVAAGVMLWLFVATSDGGLLFIPVGAIYWFLVSLLLTDNPSAPELAAEGAGAGDAAPAERTPVGPAPGPRLVAHGRRG